MRTDLALDILKITLLFLLYLFFARVLWAVWQEVRTDRRVVAPHIVNERAETRPAPVPKARKAPKGKRGRVGRLVILEPKARRGATFPLTGDITIGRDPGCTVMIEGDTFVSQRHARVYLLEGQPMVEDLGSTNGSFHNGNRLHGSRLLHPGDRVQVGYTVLEAQ
ncbi:FHA domain-containing protein [Desertimonas flava]|jgi:pSer/pThr/pTyr-binding forkhead associated (FHA) protein|uniref:FHA domain-containing protein n=1 Tax=Desertimonas flava TaxID=2064846 RepID=UPI000E34FF9E|nr:FHA domain-containing protein [Desertimonas flava]